MGAWGGPFQLGGGGDVALPACLQGARLHRARQRHRHRRRPLPDSATDSGDSGENIGGDTSEDTGSGEKPDEPTPTVVVDCNGGADFTTITEAIAASTSGDRIGLRACTYTENVDYRGKALDIYGLDVREKVIIEAASRAPVVTAARGESIGTRLAHVTLTGGGGGYGSALYVDRALFTLEDAVVRDNGSASSTFYQSAASVRLLDVVAYDNETSSRQGMEVFANDGSMHAVGFHLTCGRTAYAIYQHVDLLLTDSTLDCADAEYGVMIDGGEVHVRRSRIEASSVGVYAEDNNDTRNERVWLFNSIVVGGDQGVATSYMHVKVRNSVLWGGDRGLSSATPTSIPTCTRAPSSATVAAWTTTATPTWPAGTRSARAPCAAFPAPTP